MRRQSAESRLWGEDVAMRRALMADTCIDLNPEPSAGV